MTEPRADHSFTYRAFISYSHRDKTWADWLHKALETYRVPSRLVGRETAHGTIPRRLHPVFRDREELASATDLGRKVNEALAQSENLVVICSPASATSRWVNEEVLAYKRGGRAERVFCLIVDGEPNASDMPGRESEECFCPALRFQLDANGALTNERTEPIAADARAGKDGKANAKLKLIAGMLNVGFDALKQRELQRRNRRMVAITALALVVMAMTTVLAIAALFARHDAQVAQQAAERRQKQAEDLVGFMLGDLNDKLQEVQRSDIMQAVDDKAMAYFESLPTTDVTEEALEQRAKALEKIGSVRMGLGQLAPAVESFSASMRISGPLAAAEPADVARQIAYAQTLGYIGLTQWTQGALDRALRSFESAQEVLQRVEPHAGNNPDLIAQLVNVDNNIGHVLEARGQLDRATVQYKRVLELSQKLVAGKPDRTEWEAGLGDAHNNLGKVALMGGDLATAIAQYRADDAIETRLSARDPKNNDQRENMLRVRAILGRTLALAGDPETGTRYLQQAVDTATQLIKVDPKQTDLQERLALYSLQLGRLRRLGGNMPAADTLAAKSLEIFSALTKLDPTNSDWQQDLAEARSEQAAQLMAAGQAEAAHAQARAALTILDPLLAKQPDDRSLLLDTASAKLLLADLSSDAQAALQLRNDALQATQSVKSGRNDPRLLALQIEALLALDRKAQAQPLLETLRSSGYRDPALLAVLQREHIDYPVNREFTQRIAEAARTDTANTGLDPSHAPHPRASQDPVTSGH
ncbi:MAG: TIR domain-containing protein [Rhodanobacteraceae bacterium]